MSAEYIKGKSVEPREDGEKKWDLIINGENYTIDPNYSSDPNSEDDVSSLVMRTLHSLRNERKRELGQIYFDKHGLLRKEKERNKIRKAKEILISTIDRHIEIVQGKRSGTICFETRPENGASIPIGLSIVDE